MNSDFRKRWLAPLLILLGVLALMALYAFSISRVLLAIPEIASTFLALAIAGYVLLVAAMVTRHRRITSRALASGLVVGLVAVLGAGIVAAQAGIREHEAEEDAGAAAGEEGEGGEPVPADAQVWVAADIEYVEAPREIPAGEVTIALDNQGAITHNVVIDGTDVLVEAEGGSAATETVTLEPGSYTYYCSIPGHREAGMEGTVEVTG